MILAATHLLAFGLGVVFGIFSLALVQANGRFPDQEDNNSNVNK